MTYVTHQRRAYMSGDKTWVKVLSEDLQRDAAARAHMQEYAKNTLSAIKQVSSLPHWYSHPAAGDADDVGPVH